MNSIMVAVNVVLPMAMMMGVGVIMRLTGVTDRDTMKKVDKIIFKVLMSVLMFYNIYNTDLSNLISAGYIAYGIGGLLVLFLIALFAIWLQYWFPYLARFDDPVKRILKNTLAMMLAETKVDFRLLLLFLVVTATDVIISLRVPVLAVFMPVAYIISLNRVTERLFARYIARQEEAAQPETE